MADSVVIVDLSDQAEDFRRLALQPGMGLIDKAGAHAAILRKWLGPYLAMPRWDGQTVQFQVHDEDGQVLDPKRFQMLTAAEIKGAFRGELEKLTQKLEAAPARTGTERALRHVMLDRLKRLAADPNAAAHSGAFAKSLDPAGVWRLVWLWGFERKSSDPGTVVICKNPACRTLAVKNEEKTKCPRCDGKLHVPRSPLPMLAAVLVLLLLGGGIAWWFTRPLEESPSELASVSGQVLSRSGQKPVQGATVRVEGMETEATTDAEGGFVLEELPVEPIALLISAPGFLDAKQMVDPAELGPNKLSIPLVGAATLQGRVQDEINQTPIAGAMVVLPEWGVTAETDDAGTFIIADVPARKLQLEVAADGYRSKRLEETVASVSQSPLEVRLAGDGKLVGSVTDALTLDPVPNAAVYLLNTPLTANTDAAGWFEIAGIPTGTATIAVQAEGYQTESSEHELKGTEVRPFLAGLHGAGIVRGKVSSEADGEPLAGIDVELVHPKFQRTAKTNAQGEFEFLKLPPGEMEVKATAPGFQDASAKAIVEEQGDSVELALIGAAGLSGIVTDAAEKTPIAGVLVQIAGTELSTETADDGSYRLAGIPGRKATVQFVGRGYRQQELEADLAAKTDNTLDVELKGGTILSGIVQDALSKSPIPDADVELAGTSQKTKTDENGRFRFEDLAAGSKSLAINAAGYLPAAEETELKADQESHLEIGLEGDAIFSGTVTSAATGKPLEGVQIQLAGPSRETKTDEMGQFRLENVPGGLRELEITLADHLPARVSRNLDSANETSVEVELSGAAAIEGVVTSEQGTPLGHAVVQIKNAKAKAPVESNGEFRVEGLLPGKATAVISAKGFHPQEKTIDLKSGEPATLGTIALKPIEADYEGVAQAFEIPAPEGAIVLGGRAVVEPGVSIPRPDFRTRLERAGAKTGDVQVSLAWDNINDIDLHVQAPSGEVIYYRNRNSQCGGELDVDMNAGAAQSEEPIENIYWPLNTAPRGKYKVLVHHYANHGAADPTEFRVAVKNGGEVKYYTGKLDPDQKLFVCEFERLEGPEPVATANGEPGTLVADNPVENPETVVASENGDGGDGAQKKPPVYNRTDEEQAAQRLKLAEDLMALNKKDAAKRWLEDVISRYPNTSSCGKCQKLLDELAQTGEADTEVADGVYLADLTPLKKNVGGALQPHKALIGSEPRHHSLWTRTSIPNPPASVEYALGRRYSRLSGSVGIDESGKADRTRVSTTFQIVGDGKVLWTSQNLRNPGQTERFEVDVSQVSNLKILTDSNRIPSHYAVWVDPWLAGKGSD